MQQGIAHSLFTFRLLFPRQQWGVVSAKILLPPCKQAQVDCHLSLLDGKSHLKSPYFKDVQTQTYAW